MIKLPFQSEPLPFRPYSPPIKITNNYTYIVYINKRVNV